MTSDRFVPGALRERLSQLTRDPAHEWHRRGDLDIPDLEHSAVLMPVSDVGDDLEMVFTHRSEDLNRHSGEVSFPGGREEQADNTLVETALRETYEEIGLQPSAVDVFGALTEMPTVTGFQVVAYVGEFPATYELISDSSEIESIFRASLRRLADPSIHRVEERAFNDEVYPVHFFEYEGHTIWGATGWLLNTFLEYFDLVDTEHSQPD